ncbi:MAG: HEAT repeat domain-containing protein [Planctomycetales bacterium]|nr:HEAT repeat domain-containing protein [Planctomycetales bacterium]
MHRRGLIVVVVATLGAPPIAAAPQETSPNARATLRLGERRFLIGQSIPVQYVLENTGRQPFQVTFSSDRAFRGLQFSVRARDRDEVAVPDPVRSPERGCTGGLEITETLEPGDLRSQWFELNEYCRFVRAGRYSITVSHNLGWPPGGSSIPPAATTSVEIAVPTPEEAQGIVAACAEWDRANPGRAADDWELSSPFWRLRHPVYVPALVGLLRDQFKSATLGLSEIATPQVTERLTALLEGRAGIPEGTLAGRALVLRLPPPPEDRRRWRAILSTYGRNEDYLREQAWEPRLAPAVRRQARAYVASDHPLSVELGAYMLSCVGTADDLCVVLRALDAAMARPMKRRCVPGFLPETPEEILELEAAAHALLYRGAPVPAGTETGAGLVVLLDRWGRDSARSADSVTRWCAALRHPQAHVRERALDAIHFPAPEPLLSRVAESVGDPDLRVQVAACGAVARLRWPGARKELLTAMRATSNDAVVNAAAGALANIDADYEPVVVWAERIGAAESSHQGLSQVISFVHGGWPRGQAVWFVVPPELRSTLSQGWLQFLTAKELVLRGGRKLPLSQIPADLLPGPFAAPSAK